MLESEKDLKINELEKEIQLLKEHSKRQVGLSFLRVPEPETIINECLNYENINFVLNKNLSYNQDSEEPSIKLFESDNLIALKKLRKNYDNKVDLIYIDPPYNTGNPDFIYNDKRSISFKNNFVNINNYEKRLDGTNYNLSKHHPEKHSTWLSFMENRIYQAYHLLAIDGVMIVSINDSEYAHLKILLDGIFGEKNLMSSLIWQGTGSSLGKFISGGIDYMLVYAKDIDTQPKWRKKKPLSNDMLNLVEQSKNNGETLEQSTLKLRSFIKSKANIMDKGLQNYNSVDELGRIYSNASLTNSLYRPNLKYNIVDPLTNRVYQTPDNGWKISEANMLGLINDGLVLFGDRKYPRKKLLLEDYTFMLPSQIFTANRSSGSNMLNNILGKNMFDFPKNVEVLYEWFNIIKPKKDAIILDFFAGSGTTGHVVSLLNNEDNGNRECLLITNNENNIAQNVTRERIYRVLSGNNWADGKSHQKLRGSLSYYQKEQIIK